MNSFLKTLLLGSALLVSTSGSYATGLFSDTTRAYAVPTLVKTPQGKAALSWTEKDKNGVIYYYWAESNDKGKTFGDKKTHLFIGRHWQFPPDAPEAAV